MKIIKSAVKKWLYILTVTVPVFLLMQAPAKACSAKPDTVTVDATGHNNKVILNSRELEASFTGKIEAPVQGEITQAGENNSVEINSGRVAQSNGTHKESHDLIDLKAPSDSGSIIMDKQARHHIKITQKGKNNSVKIYSR